MRTCSENEPSHIVQWFRLCDFPVIIDETVATVLTAQPRVSMGAEISTLPRASAGILETGLPDMRAVPLTIESEYGDGIFDVPRIARQGAGTRGPPVQGASPRVRSSSIGGMAFGYGP